MHARLSCLCTRCSLGVAWRTWVREAVCARTFSCRCALVLHPRAFTIPPRTRASLARRPAPEAGVCWGGGARRWGRSFRFAGSLRSAASGALERTRQSPIWTLNSRSRTCAPLGSHVHTILLSSTRTRASIALPVLNSRGEVRSSSLFALGCLVCAQELVKCTTHAPASATTTTRQQVRRRAAQMAPPAVAPTGWCSVGVRLFPHKAGNWARVQREVRRGGSAAVPDDAPQWRHGSLAPAGEAS